MVGKLVKPSEHTSLTKDRHHAPVGFGTKISAGEGL